MMWISEPKDSNAEPLAWAFLLTQNEDFLTLKGVLTKVMYETNIMESFEKNIPEEELPYLQSQVAAETTEIEMDG